MSSRDAMSRIRALRGVRWEWRDDAPPEAKAQPRIGLIAQEVERVFPEVVTTDERGYKKVAYQGLVAPLIEAVKELDERLAALERRVSAEEPEGGRS